MTSVSAPPPYSTTNPAMDNTYPAEKPTSTYLTINAQGKSWNDYSTRGKQLEIIITDPSGNEAYRNIRPDKHSSSCILYHNSNSSSQPRKVSETTYKWGPGRHPVMKFYSSTSPSENIAEELSISSKYFSRTTVFPSTRFGKFSWIYQSRNPNGSIMGKGASDIYLAQITDAQGRDVGEREVARLVRNGETRPQGTNWHEGSGGLLELGPLVREGGVDFETFVIASVLLMLKKELDALLNNQVALIS